MLCETGEGELVFLSGGGPFGVVDKVLNDFRSRICFSAEATALPGGDFAGAKLNAFVGGVALTLGGAGSCNCSLLCVDVFEGIGVVGWNVKPAAAFENEGKELDD